MFKLSEDLLANRLEPGTFSIDANNSQTARYLPDDALVTAAALSILLCQPLLLSGAPGVGKTGAAYHIAAKVLQRKRDPIRYTVTTLTSGRDLLYRFDVLARFHDKESAPLRNFLRFEALGRAIIEACGGGAKVIDAATDKLIDDPHRIKRITGTEPKAGSYLTIRDLLQPNEQLDSLPNASVVLIDEIDKAPRDTPNDLLESFEAMRFTVDELGLKIGLEFSETARRDANPIVVCTTNAENNLPDAFLRRCVFHEIAMPEGDQLKRIIEANLRGVAHLDDSTAKELAGAAYEAGLLIYDRIKKVSRPPGTAEFIALARAFLAAKIAPEAIRSAIGSGPKLDPARARAMLGVVVKTADDLRSVLPIFADPAVVR